MMYDDEEDCAAVASATATATPLPPPPPLLLLLRSPQAATPAPPLLPLLSRCISGGSTVWQLAAGCGSSSRQQNAIVDT